MGQYTLHILDEPYWIDAYPGMNEPVYIDAYVKDAKGAVVTAPTLVSIVYTADSGAYNTTGIFYKEDLDVIPGEETYVTVKATLSDGTILKKAVLVDAPYIFPVK